MHLITNIEKQTNKQKHQDNPPKVYHCFINVYHPETLSFGFFWLKLLHMPTKMEYMTPPSEATWRCTTHCYCAHRNDSVDIWMIMSSEKRLIEQKKSLEVGQFIMGVWESQSTFFVFLRLFWYKRKINIWLMIEQRSWLLVPFILLWT